MIYCPKCGGEVYVETVYTMEGADEHLKCMKCAKLFFEIDIEAIRAKNMATYLQNEKQKHGRGIASWGGDPNYKIKGGSL